MAKCKSFTSITYILTLTSAEAYHLKYLLQNPPQLNSESENDKTYREEIFRAIDEYEKD